ncbi:MAG: helix-turn-helix transcriptional regulator [Nitrospirae bacterium]|nr:helix-turn-helix transcriptional regulator [Nitrospirota bacterium]
MKGKHELRHNNPTARAIEQKLFSEVGDTSSRIFDKILEIKRYIDENYDRRISISDVIKNSCINKTYLCKYFKLITGYSFADYINNIRVQKAKEILKNREIPVTEVAALMGYGNSSYFIEVFKKFTGYSPLEFRKIIVKKSDHP